MDQTQPGPRGPMLALLVCLTLTITPPIDSSAVSAYSSDAGGSVFADTLRLRVLLDTTVYTMAGGIGASWHAIRADLEPPGEGPFLFEPRTLAPRGSAVGGNPPLNDEAAWGDLLRAADWLGLNWIRVELSQRMYEPERGVFDWDNEEMRTLYRILDWCESRGVDVFLTQMWSNVEWNAFQGIYALQSAPRSVPDFAEGLGALMEHLTRVRGYSCIRWLVITNEPGYDWAWWLGPEGHTHSITPALRAVREALDRRGISVPLSGPDWTNPPEPTAADVPQPLDFDPFLGAYDIHSYGAPSEDLEKVWQAWADRGRDQGKPVFLSEMGNMELGWGTAHPGPKTFDASLSVAEKVLRGLRAGLHAFNRWSFVNRGDLDGQWQLVRTWDIERQTYLPRVAPEPAAYYGFGILTRFLAAHSEVLQIRSMGATGDSLLSGAVRSPAGDLSIFVVNLRHAPMDVDLGLESAGPTPNALFRYEVTEPAVGDPGFRLDPTPLALGSGTARVRLPARSLTVFSTLRRSHDEPALGGR